MTSNNQLYDVCNYKQALQASTKPLDYMFYSGKFENQQQSRILFGTQGGNNVSQYMGNLVNLESDLFGITRPLSDCNDEKYKPGQQNYKFKHLPESQLNLYNKVEMPTAFSQYNCNFFNLN